MGAEAPVKLASGGADIRDLLRQIARQKWVILGVLSIVLGATVFGTLGMAKVYESSTTLEYDPNPDRPLGSNVEDVANPIGNFLLAKEWYQTQNMIISSRRIARKAVERLAIHRNADFMRVPPEERQRWRGGDVEDAVSILIGSLTVRQERDTRVVRLSVESGDPKQAALLANALADAYIEWTMEQRLGSTVSALEWLRGQLDDISRRLETSELALHDFRRTNNVLSVSLADQQDVLSQTIHGFSGALTDASTRRIQIEAKLRQLEEAVQRDPMAARISLLTTNPAVGELRVAHRAAVTDRDALALKYGPSHPEMQRLQSRIDHIVEQARTEITGVLTALRSELNEIQDVERGLQHAKFDAQSAGLELNLREIDYNRLERERANNEKLHGILLQRTTETNLTKMLRVSSVRLVDRAMPADSPIRPRFLVNILLGAFVGVLAAFAAAVVRLRMDRSINTPEDVTTTTGAPLLGLVPKIDDERKGVGEPRYGGSKRSRRRPAAAGASLKKDLVVHTHPLSSVAECFRIIRTNLAFMSPDKPLHALVVTSPSPVEGKSTVAISLAITMAKSGRRVVVIDTDLRRPRVHKAFGMSSRVGITSTLAGEAALADCIQASEIENLFVLPCGPIPPNPSELLHTARFKALIEELKSEFDLLVFDSPPVGVVTDAAIVAPQVDGALVVVKAESTSRDALGHTARQMRDVGARLLGCVLNDVDMSRQSSYGGYYYYYYNKDYYYTADESDRGSSPPPAGGAPLDPATPLSQ